MMMIIPSTNTAASLVIAIISSATLISWCGEQKSQTQPMRKRTIRPRVPFCHSENVHLWCNKEELTVTNAQNHRSWRKWQGRWTEQRPKWVWRWVLITRAHYPNRRMIKYFAAFILIFNHVVLCCAAASRQVTAVSARPPCHAPSCVKVASSVENFNMSRPTSQLHIGLMFQRTIFMSHI